MLNKAHPHDTHLIPFFQPFYEYKLPEMAFQKVAISAKKPTRSDVVKNRTFWPLLDSQKSSFPLFSLYVAKKRGIFGTPKRPYFFLKHDWCRSGHKMTTFRCSNSETTKRVLEKNRTFWPLLDSQKSGFPLFSLYVAKKRWIFGTPKSPYFFLKHVWCRSGHKMTTFPCSNSETTKRVLEKNRTFWPLSDSQ